MDSGLMGELVDEMASGRRVVAVFANMGEARLAFNDARRLCEDRNIKFSSRCNNSKVLIESGSGSVRFVSEMGMHRGVACDVFYLADRARFREWMAPLATMAAKRVGCSE